MNRKEFLNAVAVLGGASLLPASALSAADRKHSDRRDTRRMDPSKVVLLSDIHISGELENGTPVVYPYNPVCLELRVDEILKMRPLPANVIVFGDVAWDYGLEEDYRYAVQLLKPLEDAGIKLTLAMGNHDRRAAFFKVFPEYAEKTPVPGRVVSVVSLPDVDIVMLDSLAELPDLKPKQGTTVGGKMDDAQLAWLKEYLTGHDRPVLLGAHHPLSDLPKLSNLIVESECVAGYIYGHYHIWNKSVNILRPRKGLHMVPALALPALFYGDIGMAVMTADARGAVVEYSSKGFWWPQPVPNPPAEWLQRQKDLENEKCTFLFKR